MDSEKLEFKGIIYAKINNLIESVNLNKNDITYLDNQSIQKCYISIKNNMLTRFIGLNEYYLYCYDKINDVWITDFEILKIISHKRDSFKNQ